MTDEEKRIVETLKCCDKSGDDGYDCFGCPLYGLVTDECRHLFLLAAGLIEKLADERDDALLTLGDVIHTVDKWLRGESDPDKPESFTSRAADAREIATRTIEKLERDYKATCTENERIRQTHVAHEVYQAALDELKQVKQERDAAIQDINAMLQTHLDERHLCEFCDKSGGEMYSIKCPWHEKDMCLIASWRGMERGNNG